MQRLSCGRDARLTAAAADVDPDDGCGRTTRPGRTVAAPVAAAAAPPATASPRTDGLAVAGRRPAWPAYVHAHGAHAAADRTRTGKRPLVLT